ncbi:ABC transporter permease [Paenibacillus montanisoli]|uniref:ABC transporter permease n=1 Tax=Paenibacillus montanisoli TaxID=2081970 RepID=A0A328U7H7_9BACL|nr:ABC transporter permease [Paenibacillus montanisoli]RAP77743.1 ABC transporter permease [Paenibacillus montanisoli]
MNRRGSGKHAHLPVLAFVLLLAALWEAGTSVFDVPHYIVPKLTDVFASMWENKQLLGKHFAVTLWESLLGLGLSVLFGTLSAGWIESSGLAKKTIYPLIVGSQTIPIIAISPIMVMWFGYEIWSKVAVVILFTFFPIAVNTADGLRSADPDIGSLMRTMGARKRDLYLKWKIPSAMPGFFTGLKMAAAISVGGATLGEWLGGENGLGMYTKRASNVLRGEAVFSGVLLLSVMGMMLFFAVQWLERASLGHRRSEVNRGK